MKRMKQTIAIILSVLMLFATMPMTAMAETETGRLGTSNVYYELTDEGVLRLYGTGATPNYPAEAESSPFAGKYVEKVVVEQGITSIGNYIFAECWDIEEVSLPKSLRYVGNVAFGGCSKLKEITFNSYTENFGFAALYNCRSLKSVTFKSNKINCFGLYSGGANSLLGHVEDATIYVNLPMMIEETQDGVTSTASSYEDAVAKFGQNNNTVYCVNDNAKIKWKNYDGTVLETDENATQGEIPTFDGETPSRPSDDTNAYYFTGWDVEPFEVIGDMSYTATFGSYGKASYVDENGMEQEVFARPLTGTETELPGGWYVVNQNINSTNQLKFAGDANLILADGATMEMPSSSNIVSEGNLSVYCQKGKSGALNTGSLGGEASVQIYGGNINVPLMLMSKHNINIFDGNVNAGYIWAMDNESEIRILGGTTYVEYQLAARGSIILGYKNPTDSIYIDNFGGTDITEINIAEGQTFANKEDSSQTFTGSAATADLKEKTLVPYNFFSITYNESQNGSVSGARTAHYGDEVTLTVTPDTGYALAALTVKDAGENEIAVTDGTFLMPQSDVTVTAAFKKLTYVAGAEPYINDEGEYILGTVAHYVDENGVNYAVGDDGAVGEKLESLALSYFDFSLRQDGTYQINYYTGPAIADRLVIPETYNGKAITVLGNNNNERLYGKDKTQFELVLTKNITEIKPYTFYVLYVTKVSGDTSGLSTIGNYAFSWANGPGNYTLELTLDYPGTVKVSAGTFNHMIVTAHVKHATVFSTTYCNQQSLTYDFTDSHPYGNAVWTWAEDYSSATARFTCTDSRCGHRETVSADITDDKQGNKIVYTATATIDGNTYTDTKEVILKNGWINENDTLRYYADDVPVKGVVRVEYPDASYGYAEDAEGIDDAGFPNDGKGTFILDENGVLQQEINGLYIVDGDKINAEYPTDFIADGNTVYVDSGEILWHPGEVANGEDIYYFAAGNKQVKDKDYSVYRVDTLTRGKKYTFDSEGKLCKYNGLVDIEGETYYYEDYAKTYAGLININGDYYYINSACKAIKGRSYYVSKTNGLMPAGSYEFDADGKMITAKNGIVKEADGWFYYENNKRVYKGLFKIGNDYYYAKTNCEVLHDIEYYISKTNGLLPQGKYTFDSEGKLVMLDGIVKNGDTWTYYVNGAKTYAGLFKIGNDIYYAKSDCTVVHGTDYYVSKTNDILPQGKYTFDADGKLVMLDGIVKNGDDWTYYENGAKVYAGLIEIDGDYYYVNSSFKVIHGQSYFVSKTNGIVKNGTYTFDKNGVMQQ